jgi:hypothetical protein
MSAEDSIRILLGRAASGREPLDAAEWKRAKARVAWVRETVAALIEAQRRMDALAQSVRGTDEQGALAQSVRGTDEQGTRCSAAVDRVSEEEFNRIFDEEQAKVSAILDQFAAIRERDEWPPEVYFGGN